MTPATSTLARRVVETAVGRISYIEAGDGPALLLLHGLGGNARSWRRQVEHFSDRYRVIAWDAPGYGESDPAASASEGQGTGDAEGAAGVHAAVALALLDALGVDRVDVVGHSMGGIVATMLAANVPDRVRRLVLSCSFTGAAAPEGQAMAAGFRARIDDLRTLPREVFGRARALGMTAPDVTPAALDEVASIAAEVRPEGFEAACQMLATADTRGALATVRCPVLVLSADQDRVIAKPVVDAMAALVPAAKRVHLIGAGHAPYIETPDAYNAVLSLFLGQTP